MAYGLDCVDAVPLRRPRFCWTTEVIEGVIPGVVVESKSYWRQVQAQAEYPKTEQWIDPGFHWNGTEETLYSQLACVAYQDKHHRLSQRG